MKMNVIACLALLWSVLGSVVNAKKLGLCEFDCDEDSDCVGHLWCADAHKRELFRAGLDTRKVKCGHVGKWNEEVCFDPKTLYPNSGGGGDPHFRTFDGTKYSYHGQCDLVMLRGTKVGNTGIDIALHARTEIKTGWSLISNAALQLGYDVFELVNDGTYYFNSVINTDLPIMTAHYNVSMSSKVVESPNAEGVVTEYERSTYRIVFNGDHRIEMILFKNLIFININAVIHNSEGMLGSQDKVGMIGRDGSTVFEDPKLFGSHWQVTDKEPMLFQSIRSPQYPASCLLPKTDSRRLRATDHRRLQAQEACAGLTDDMFDFCVEDITMTGDLDLVHAYGYAH